jgi:acyl-CoA reductase-like NAD-dependent aldehyde dehydrogenase
MIKDVPIHWTDNMPFGDWKDSGFGREGDTTRWTVSVP